jgi:hypothetical protein
MGFPLRSVRPRREHVARLARGQIGRVSFRHLNYSMWSLDIEIVAWGPFLANQHLKQGANQDHGEQQQDAADPVFAAHRPPAFRLANTTCARANSRATVFATSANAFGSTIVDCSGQVTLTIGGVSGGSISSIFSWSWSTSADANGVMG